MMSSSWNLGKVYSKLWDGRSIIEKRIINDAKSSNTNSNGDVYQGEKHWKC